jgi:hypothetical protein
MNFYNNIPAELRKPALWLQYYLSPDPKKPGKKPRKHPCVKYATPEARAANLRSLDYLLENRPPQKGVQRYVDKAEGFTYIDIDRVHDPETGETQPWAAELIDWLDTYTEISASRTGFHLVCRGTLPEDFKLDPVQVEIYAGNIPNKLIAMTGDVHDLHCTIENRQEQLQQLLRRAKAGEFGKAEALAAVDITNWRTKFHTVDELPDGDIRFLIENVLPEGVSFIGALSGAGKTWFCLSMARALTTGKKFLGNWNVPEQVNVLYLCPEMNAKTFKKRCRLFGISERFHCQTISDGVPLDLCDPLLAQAVAELKPVVFLDTAIRFAGAEDENSSSQNAQGLAAAVFALIHLGAQAVVCLHHRAKDTARQEELTLENTLRGTGDLGAMCDAVWGLQYDRGTGDPQYAKESKKLVRLAVSCVKARDFCVPDDFRIQLSQFIDRTGDFGVLTTDSAATRQAEIEALNEAISANPKIEKLRLEEKTHIGRNRQEGLAGECGWFFDKKTKWSRKLPVIESDGESAA